MQESLTFPTVGSPHHRFTFSQSYFTDYSERCSPVSTPFVSAPSSPGRHCDGGFYFSAPTSPYWGRTFTAVNEGTVCEYPSSIPLHWDGKPGTPRRKSSGKDEAAGSFLTASDFEFSARFAELDDPSLSPTPMSSANELFCNGQIKPLRIPTACMGHHSSTSSRNNTHGHAAYRMTIQEQESSSIGTIKQAVASGPFALEVGSRYGLAGSSNSSISAPHSPRFSSTLGCSDAHRSASSDLSRGKPTSSLSAPQSPLSPLNRVKGALCGVSPSRIDRAFNTSMHTAIRASQPNVEGSSRINKAMGSSMEMPAEGSNHQMDASKQEREGFRRSGRSVLSLALRSYGASHRRTRSFSPLRIFQRSDHPPSYVSSSIGAPPTQAMEQENTHRLSQDTSTNEKKPHEDSTSAQKGSIKKWTLKDLLHRKSGGENRWNSSRSSSRHSRVSTDSTSSIEKTCGKSLSAGRSSSESSRSSASAHTCTKDVIVSMTTPSSRAKTQVRENMEQFKQVNSSKKGYRHIVGDARTQNHSIITPNDGKVKMTCQRGIKAYGQKGTHQGPGMSTSEMQWTIQKAQSERGTLCEGDQGNNGKAKSTTQRGILTTQKSNKGWISPHEMHYVMHKAQTEELRKRTFLPYRQGLLGCLGFTSRSYRTVSTISKTLQSVSG